jgi:hypothetical protein
MGSPDELEDRGAARGHRPTGEDAGPPLRWLEVFRPVGAIRLERQRCGLGNGRHGDE